MKKTYLLTFAIFLSTQAMAVEQDSVYTWGAWAEGIQPAAGPVAKVTPPPAQTPNINFRPNENSAFLREAAIVFRVAPPVITGAAQVPNVVIAPSSVPTTPISSL
ncbi:MAG: hypothetical protein OQK46_05915 [Gammaproteobacteria bacterium]|nr:hypothetical protein [Gammaproteobacteria bacterium]